MAKETPSIRVRCCALPAVQIAGNGKRAAVVASVLVNTLDNVEIDMISTIGIDRQ